MRLDRVSNRTTQTFDPQPSTVVGDSGAVHADEQRSTLKPQPSTHNLQPSTLIHNAQLSTLNPQPSTPNPQLSTLNPHAQRVTLNPQAQPSTINPPQLLETVGLYTRMNNADILFTLTRFDNITLPNGSLIERVPSRFLMGEILL